MQFGPCQYSPQTITGSLMRDNFHLPHVFGCCGRIPDNIGYSSNLEEALLLSSCSPGVESVDEFFEMHDVLQHVATSVSKYPRAQCLSPKN